MDDLTAYGCTGVVIRSLAAWRPQTDSLRVARSDSKSSEPHFTFSSDFSPAFQVSKVDDPCGLCQVSGVIRFGDDAQHRCPPAKHWAPFVRGCVPVDFGPGHDKGRLFQVDRQRRFCDGLRCQVTGSRVVQLFLA